MCENILSIGNRKEVILKSILTIAAGSLVFGSSQLMACPYMDGKQKVTDLHQQDSTEHSLVASEVETIDPVLLAKLLLEKQEPVQEQIN